MQTCHEFTKKQEKDKSDLKIQEFKTKDYKNQDRVIYPNKLDQTKIYAQI